MQTAPKRYSRPAQSASDENRNATLYEKLHDLVRRGRPHNSASHIYHTQIKDLNR